MSDDAKPDYLRGRGNRGRGTPYHPTAGDRIIQRPGRQNIGWRNQDALSTYSKRSQDSTTSSDQSGGYKAGDDTATDCNVSATAKFRDALTEHQQSAQRHLHFAKEDNNYCYSSDDDDGDDDDADDKDVFKTLVKSFNLSSGDVACDLGKTHEYVVNSLQTKANVCLICIESIKKTEPIWNCTGCFTTFHIMCIQRWVKDGVYLHSALSKEHFPDRDVPWFCPKCRHEYSQKDAPKQYRCYCGKVVDPVFDPWLVPHSCGQECGRMLRPDCGHTCHLLCHPGPCPPCPQTVKVTCHCKKMKPELRRCGASEWSCGKPCMKPLACGRHHCSLACHKGGCAECRENVMQKCRCGRHSDLRPCGDGTWHCAEVCGKLLTCGHHTCSEVCHSGDCTACPRSGKQTCPCGKTSFDLPCTEEAPTCMETCGQLRACGRHRCMEHCHVGPCSTCREMVRKKCRCGKREREIQCYKEFQCDVKCANLRDCGIHQCKRKCCDGNCPPCTMVCGKMLGCHQHKCPSICHRGPCYPCPLVVEVSCACGKTKISVPCGAEKSSRPPRCRQPCRRPPDCHHESRELHHCHFGRCPPCQQPCAQLQETCQHRCTEPCHSAVWRRRQEPENTRAGPWELPRDTAVNMEMVCLPCPACPEPVVVTCLGGHETSSERCSEVVSKSCGRRCGRRLTCSNHLCQLECHTVTDAIDSVSAGMQCEVCELTCQRPRPDGCSHQCQLGVCHRGDCPPCRQLIRMRCHCSLVVRHIECSVWTNADTEHRNRLQSCGGSCPKHLACGHTCGVVCHPAPCSSESRSCTAKVKVKCPCGRRKADSPCCNVQAGTANIDCDDVCYREKEQQLKQREERERAEKEAELERQKAELEKFERMSRGRRRRQRRDRGAADDGSSVLRKLTVPAMISILVILMSVFVYWLLSTK